MIHILKLSMFVLFSCLSFFCCYLFSSYLVNSLSFISFLLSISSLHIIKCNVKLFYYFKWRFQFVFSFLHIHAVIQWKMEMYLHFTLFQFPCLFQYSQSDWSGLEWNCEQIEFIMETLQWIWTPPDLPWGDISIYCLTSIAREESDVCLAESCFWYIWPWFCWQASGRTWGERIHSK